jgi:uncharacterized membrane protein
MQDITLFTIAIGLPLCVALAIVIPALELVSRKRSRTKKDDRMVPIVILLCCFGLLIFVVGLWLSVAA